MTEVPMPRRAQRDLEEQQNRILQLEVENERAQQQLAKMRLRLIEADVLLGEVRAAEPMLRAHGFVRLVKFVNR
jgi:hypothetical protein